MDNLRRLVYLYNLILAGEERGRVEKLSPLSHFARLRAKNHSFEGTRGFRSVRASGQGSYTGLSFLRILRICGDYNDDRDIPCPEARTSLSPLNSPPFLRRYVKVNWSVTFDPTSINRHAA